MEKQVQAIFYVDISEEAPQTTDARAKAAKTKVVRDKGTTELPIYQVARPVPYEGGLLQIYCGHVPRALLQKEEAMQKKAFWQKITAWRKKPFRRKGNRLQTNSWQMALAQMINRAEERIPIKDKDDILFSGELLAYVGKENRIPEVLYAALLKSRKEIPQTVSITIPEDAPSLLGDSICRMLRPYLSKVNYVVFAGPKTGQSLWAEQYFFEEYGIISSFEKKPAKNSIWLDFEKEKAAAHKRYAVENSIYHLNEAEVLKFLDTITKNGYNTEVN